MPWHQGLKTTTDALAPGQKTTTDALAPRSKDHD